MTHIKDFLNKVSEEENINRDVSAFATSTAKAIEQIISNRTQDLQYQNNSLRARILTFRHKLHGELLDIYDDLFKIEIK